MKIHQDGKVLVDFVHFKVEIRRKFLGTFEKVEKRKKAEDFEKIDFYPLGRPHFR